MIFLIKKRIVAAFAVCIPLIAIAALWLLLPSAIVVRSGESFTLSFRLPVKCEVLSGTAAVSAVSDKPVEDNISLSKPITLRAESEGGALLRLSVCGIPVKNSRITVLPDTKLIPCGRAVGLELETDGVLVLGTGEVRTGSGRYVSPCEGVLKSGDLIKSVNGRTLTDKESLIESVENSADGTLKISAERSGKTFTAEVVPAISSESGKKKLGLWVRDSTQGIGTLTCYDENGSFYALGHPVTDVDTGDIMKISGGKIMPTVINAVNAGRKGSPGELIGSTDKDKVLGSVSVNSPCGIYGRLNNKPAENEKGVPIALKGEVKEGAASILANVDGSGVKSYSINIESTDTLSMDSSKAMVIRITDNGLIKKTGGIVQGMSGAPILQNGRLVGAVTHVFVQEPEKGYGIYIEDMLMIGK